MLALKSISSLDSKLRADSGTTLGELIAADPESPLDDPDRQQSLRQILDRSRLSGQERDIVIRRHASGETLEAIGKRHSLSRERVRQISKKAMLKLKRVAVRLEKA